VNALLTFAALGPPELSRTGEVLSVTRLDGPGTFCESDGQRDWFVWSGDRLYCVWEDSETRKPGGGEGFVGYEVDTRRFRERHGASLALIRERHGASLALTARFAEAFGDLFEPEVTEGR
jgi:hypothetical protein